MLLLVSRKIRVSCLLILCCNYLSCVLVKTNDGSIGVSRLQVSLLVNTIEMSFVITIAMLDGFIVSVVATLFRALVLIPQLFSLSLY